MRPAGPAAGSCGTWSPPPPFLDSFDLAHVVVRGWGAGEDRGALLAALVGALPRAGSVQVWTELPHDPADARDGRHAAEFARLRDGGRPEAFQTVQTRPDEHGRSTTVVVERDPSRGLLDRLVTGDAVATGALRTCLTDGRCQVPLRPGPAGVEVLGADPAAVERVAAAAGPSGDAPGHALR